MRVKGFPLGALTEYWYISYMNQKKPNSMNILNFRWDSTNELVMLLGALNINT